MNKLISTILFCIVFGTIYLYDTEKKPQQGYFWIDNNRFNQNSIITVKTNLDENNEIFYCIIVDSLDGRQYVEFFTDEIATADEWLESWIMAYKDGLK